MHKVLRSIILLAVLAASGKARAQLPALETLSRITLPANCFAGPVTTQGDYAYLLTWQTSSATCGLKVIDIRNPAAPIIVGTSTESAVGNDLVVVGGYAYVAQGGGMVVFDVRTPTAPGGPQFLTNKKAERLAASGPYLFATDYDQNPGMTNCPGCGPTYGGIRVYDAANPLAPVQVARLALNGTPRHIALSGTKLFVAEFESTRLKVIDVSQPAALHEIASLAFPEWPMGLAVAGTYAYVMTHGQECEYEGSCWPTAGDIRVVDVRYPACPREVATIHRSGAPELAWAADETLYEIEQYGSHLFALDLASPTAPVDVAVNVLGPSAWTLRPSVSHGAVFVPMGGGAELLVLKAYERSDFPPGGVCLP